MIYTFWSPCRTTRNAEQVHERGLAGVGGLDGECGCGRGEGKVERAGAGA